LLLLDEGERFGDIYAKILNENDQLLLNKLLNNDRCLLEPDVVLKKCIIEPIETIFESKINDSKIPYLILVIDGLDTTQNNNEKDTKLNNCIESFILGRVNSFPKWFKFLLTTTSTDNTNTYYYIHLNNSNTSNSKNDEKSNIHFNNNHFTTKHLTKDINDYILYRIQKSTDIQKNILYFNNCNTNQQQSNLNNSDLDNYLNCSTNDDKTNIVLSPKLNKGDATFQHRFQHHLCMLSEFNFLFVKLTLDLIERGHLVIKSSNFKVLPATMLDLIRLYFNLKFASKCAYERLAAKIFSICLVTFKPMTLNEIHETINCNISGFANHNSDQLIIDNTSAVTWKDLVDQIANLDEFLIADFDYYNKTGVYNSPGIYIYFNIQYLNGLT
jgi:hypothetical protein